MSKRCGCGDILLCKYLIFIFIWVLIFSSVILTTVRDGMLSLGAPLGLTRTALGLWTDFSVLGLYLGWWLSELLPEVFPAMLEGCLKCVFLKLFTNSYRLLNSSQRTLFLFLHGQIESERTWAACLTSSPTPRCCGTLLIACVLVCIWSFCCFLPRLFYTFEWCNYFGASAECLRWESEKWRGQKKIFSTDFWKGEGEWLTGYCSWSLSKSLCWS